MSAPSAKAVIAYLAQGKIRIKAGEEGPRTVDSVYGNVIREKAVRAQQKHSWKSTGDDASPFGAMLWGKPVISGGIPLAITSICGGKEPGGLVYSLESGSLCALLEVGQLGAEERRLWNFFSAIYPGRKLTPGGGKAREMDMKQMMIWGNVVRARNPTWLRNRAPIL